jgi:hypothetical protein
VTPLGWRAVAAFLVNQEEGTVMELERWRVEEPRAGGLKATVALPVGQRGEYRLRFSPRKTLMVLDLGPSYRAWVEVAQASPLENQLRDSPGSTVVGMVAAGALLGLALGRTKDAALTGAALGGLAALAGVGLATAETAPRVSATAIDIMHALGSRPLPAAAARRRPPSRKPRALVKRPARR